MKNIRVIIVEDELLPRETLIQKLNTYHEDIEIVAAFEDAETALIEILKSQPDLLFLDIRLPGKNGLWLADQLQTLRCNTFEPPAIIFTTAFDDSQYMLNAIKVSAIDYLIKPILIEQLNAAVERFKNRNNSSRNFKDMMEREQMLRFKNLGGLILLHADEIAYAKADGNYTEMFLSNGESEYIFERLGDIEKQLTHPNFVRIAKSLIINKKYLRKINSKKSSCQLMIQDVSYEVELPADSLKKLKAIL